MSDVRADQGALPRRATPAGATPSPARTVATAARPTTGRPSPSSLVVLVAGLLITAVLAWGSAVINNHTENHLLKLQVAQAGSVLTAVIPDIQTPLASAAALAAADGGSPTQFADFISPDVGRASAFVSASLWQTVDGDTTLLARAGAAPELTQAPARQKKFFASAVTSHQLDVLGFIASRRPRLGYGYTVSRGAVYYTVYAESALPASRRTAEPANSPFADLNFAVYLGPKAQNDRLISASTGHLPITGRVQRVTVPFGTSEFTLVASPTQDLAGGLSANLPWIVGVLGALVAIGAALAANRLVRRRERAERLSVELEALYEDQRGIAEQLQHSLLPPVIPQVPGLEIAVRYVAGVAGVDVGGDWYDVVPIDEGRRALFMVGDVSGRGLRAASIMARLRFAMLAYAAQGDPPDAIVAKLGGLLHIETDGHFATVLCGLIDIERHQVTLVSAGHPPPLVAGDGRGEYVATPVGPPVGVLQGSTYRSVEVAVQPRATFLSFTDGLVERRGEHLDAGLERLKSAVLGHNGSLEELVSAVVEDVSLGAGDDDTVIVGFRWLN